MPVQVPVRRSPVRATLAGGGMSLVHAAGVQVHVAARPVTGLTGLSLLGLVKSTTVTVAAPTSPQVTAPKLSLCRRR